MDKEIQILARISDLNDGINEKILDDHKFFIYKNGDEIRVYDSICPHQGGMLHCKNTQNTQEIYCKVHNWRFNEKGECLTTSARLIEHKVLINSNDIAIHKWGGGKLIQITLLQTSTHALHNIQI